MDIKELEYIVKLTEDLKLWRKTEYVSPHEYIVCTNRDFLLYQLLRDLIEKDGYVEHFKGQAYKYYNIGEYKYWIIEHILNRAKIK